MKGKNNIPQFVNSVSFMSDKNYVNWLSDLKKRIRIAQVKAAVNVNVEMLKLYWSLGEDICNKQKQYKWGAKIIDKLSLDLRAEFPQTEGFSRTNLYYIKHWYEFFSVHHEIVHQLGGQIERMADRALNNFDITLPQPQNELANEILKDPYKFDFISMQGKFDERDLENHHSIGCCELSVARGLR